MAVTADLAAGVLTVTGDAADNAITTGREAAGNIQVDGGAVPITGGPSATANTTAISILGQDGNDTVTLDASAGGLPPVALDGGAGNDTAVIDGEDAAEVFTITANGSHVSLNRTSPDPFAVDIGTTENLVLHAGGGDDIITAGNGLAPLISLTLDGGDGNDTITGGDGSDLLIGGNGNDVVTGGRGNDTALLGNGDDTYIWNPGDGSDMVEGGAGTDTLQFNGANIAENIDISANGSRVRMTRDVANVTMDLNGIEKIAFHALGGADHVTIHDLAGTDVKQVLVDLSSPANSGTGDGAADTVTVEGTGGIDRITVTQSGGTILVDGLPAEVSILGQEAANDSLIINGFGGADNIDASGLGAGSIKLTIDGGAGDDVIVGSAGNDLIRLGAGDDTYVFKAGSGSDVITDFIAGAGTDDRIDLRSFKAAGIHDLAAVLALATQAGADTVIDFGGNILTLDNVTKTDLSDDDFIFGGPSVTSVTTSGTGITAGSGDLNAGHVVTFTLTFDENVTVTGQPHLLLNDGGFASFVSGSGTNALTYQYTVAAGENTPDLAVIGSDLHGGTMKDQFNHDADLTGAIGNPAGTLQIDTIAPHLTDITAAPAGGTQTAGSTIQFTLDFDEAVHLAGGSPTLSLNDGGTATFDAAASALLGDPSKLVFDHVVTAGNPPTSPLAITGFSANGAVVSDIAGNLADLTHVAHTFDDLLINENTLPAFTLNGFTRPELHLNASGQILLDDVASAFAAKFGLEYLYLGVPPGTPYPPIDLH
ncbi:S-layer family protein [Bradyrhizobium sp. CCBAU 53421]|uniref:beta strand repeat-containing protein n=1 Tax=Bradyrhizobium sp. CCBAU 53421 TaxID=1325120 RepID=UPI00188B774B|nr:hypothetical protein [Bradyrhizobium sp. CCBAU 53421]QOZ32426.1 hypothetical protein XH92_12550 [Bradyrhizobium sp. CCBAU 53421]